MSHYVDGFVIPLPKDKIEAYRKLAELASQVWKDHGALEYRECVGDDLEIEKVISFNAAVTTKPDETVVFAWIVFESREHRDQVNAAVMKDPRMANMMDECPFDCGRMVYGGFKTIVEA